MRGQNMTEEKTLGDVINTPEQGIQAANAESLAKSDPVMEGLQESVKIEGVVKEKPEEKPVEPSAPVAAPKQQIAPVNADGDHTSSRESPKTDMPVEKPQVSQNTGVSEDSNPSAEAARPSVPEAPVPPQQEEAPVEVPFEEMSELDKANNLLDQIPGRLRLY